MPDAGCMVRASPSGTRTLRVRGFITQSKVVARLTLPIAISAV